MTTAIEGALKKVRSMRIKEQKDAAADPELNLLGRYPAFLARVQSMLGTQEERDDGRKGERAPLYRIESVASFAQETRTALHAIVSSKAGQSAMAEIAEECRELLPDGKAQSDLGAACRDVAQIAMKDAILFGVVMFLHDQAVARPMRRVVAANWDDAMKEKARQREKARRAGGGRWQSGHILTLESKPCLMGTIGFTALLFHEHRYQRRRPAETRSCAPPLGNSPCNRKCSGFAFSAARWAGHCPSHCELIFRSTRPTGLHAIRFAFCSGTMRN